MTAPSPAACVAGLGCLALFMRCFAAVGVKQVPTGRGLRDKREAQWLAATMREALGD